MHNPVKWTHVFCTAAALLTLFPTPNVRAEENEFRDLQLLGDVMAIIRRSYVDEVPMEKLVQGAIDGMLATLDPHSSFMAPENFKEMQIDTAGKFGGVGIEISMRGDEIVVITPIEDTPAARAGILAGDRIVRIDGQDARELGGVNEAVKLMRGDKGTTITLSIMRDGFDQPKDFPLQREVIRVHSVKSRTLEPGYGYIRLTQFQESTAAETEKALKDLATANPQGMKGLILDLRNNPGGLLDQAVGVADLFLDEGLIVYTEGREDGSRMQFNAHHQGSEPAYPVIVLINGGSASASEIVAGALQDQKRAIVAGTQSFGKGSVQTIVPLREENGLRLTTARYFTPKGTSIQAQGITPDIAIKALELRDVDNDPHQFREKDLRNHFEQPKKAVKEKSLPAGDKSEDSPVDYQLQRALEILKGADLLRATRVSP